MSSNPNRSVRAMAAAARAGRRPLAVLCLLLAASAGPRATAWAAPAATTQVTYEGKTYTLVLEPGAQTLKAPDGSTLNVHVEPPGSDAGAARGTAIPAVPNVGGTPAPPAPAGLSPQNLALIGGAFALILAAVLLFFLVIKPRQRRKPMMEALAIIHGDDRSNFPRAETLLGAALVNGMRLRDIATARFALAYVRTQQGRFAEALTTVEEQVAAGDKSRETLYLQLYLNSRLKKHDEVEKVYAASGKEVEDLLDAKLIASISALAQGREHWGHRDVAAAMECFERVRTLGVLAAEVPGRVAEQQILFGVMSLFDHNVEEAARHFRGAKDAAAKAGRTSIDAEVGLLLCQWKEPRADFDGTLTELTKSKAMSELAAAAKKAAAAAPKPDAAKPPEAGKPSEKKPEQKMPDAQRLLRGILLLHAVSLLREFQLRQAGSGLPADQQKVLAERIEAVAAADPEMPDPDILAGFMGYYFAQTDAQRKAAVAHLESAAKKGANLPEIRLLIEDERKAEKGRANVTDRFLAMLRGYLTDQEVPEPLRRKLHAHLTRLGRYKTDTLAVADGESENGPSLEGLRNRTALLSLRIPRLLAAAGEKLKSEDRASIETLATKVDATSKDISTKVESLQSSEEELMAMTSEVLLPEEPAKAAPGAPLDPAQNPVRQVLDVPIGRPGKPGSRPRQHSSEKKHE